ncbi:MAG TPA: GNAT family N-acetyltransferase [Candidatus Nanoarchaeia archaeon]|nr:GNAT family N-acetyltransferase [Candidatus Nanoarchaeia archaeon]
MAASRASPKFGAVVKLRVFEPGDLGHVKNLIDSTIDVIYSYYPIEFINYWKNSFHSEERILAEARQGLIIVAELNKRIVGTGTLIGKEISRVFVMTKFHRKGIGKLIMSNLELRAKKDKVEVVYLTSTAVSKAFYESLGYSTIEGEIFSAEDSLVVGYFRMKKTIH